MGKGLFVLVVAIAAWVRAAEPDVVVRATGVAATYRAAVNAALVSALERHEGVTVSATEVVKSSESGSGETVGANGALDERTKATLNDSIAKSMEKWANGRIKGYDVASERVENGKCRVEVDVRFAGKYSVGLPEGSRRRMVVGDFRPETGDSFSWCGQADSSVQWAATLAQKLDERLTQTRKFTMLDRKFDAAVAAELARLGAKNAAPEDSVRLNRRLGTDYLLVGGVKFFQVTAPAVNPLTGQALPMPPQPFCDVSYRVLLAPTGQLKWSDTVRLDAGAFAASSISAFAVATADEAARRIVEGLMANVLPFEIVGRNGAGEIVIGEGGKSVAVGDRFTVYALGEDMKDSRTGEVLDRVETPVGDVEIVRVSAKVSYARVLGGDVSRMTPGARLRRVPVPSPAEGAAAPAAAPATTVRGTENGGVAVPF